MRRTDRRPVAGHEVRDLPAYTAVSLFDGYPYLVTALTGPLHHVIVLPGGLEPEELLALGRRQHAANRLPTSVVLGPDTAVYFGEDGETVGDPPRCTHPVADRLLGPEAFAPTPELGLRERRLRAFAARSRERNGGGFLMDRMRGRPATTQDVERLAAAGAAGVPAGLIRCEACTEYRGEYLPDHDRGLVVTVFCSCANHNRCARCLAPLREHRLAAAFFDEDQRQVFHVPAFCALSHACRPVADAS